MLFRILEFLKDAWITKYWKNMQKNGKLKNKNAKALWKMNALHSVCFWFVPICGEDFSWDNYEVVK